MLKDYILYTNVLIEDENCIVNLRNGEENNIYIPSTVIEELDKLKDKKPRLKTRVFKAIDKLNEHLDEISILRAPAGAKENSEDNKIIEEI